MVHLINHMIEMTMVTLKKEVMYVIIMFTVAFRIGKELLHDHKPTNE